MRISLENLELLYPGHPLHGQQVYLLLEEGEIVELGTEAHSEQADLVIAREGLCLSPGWMDGRVHGVGRGTEHRENPESLNRAALGSGFTELLMLPDTLPAITDEHDLEAQAHRYSRMGIKLHQLGGATQDLEQGDMTEIASLQAAGALAIGLANTNIADSLKLRNLLTYCHPFGLPFVDLALDHSLASKGLMHEGLVSTQLGLPGIPVQAETIALAKQIQLVEYTGAHLHISGISSQAGVEMLRAAKAKGLPLSCDVHLLNLCFTDKDLMDFDTNLKLRVPLRAEQDRQALLQGLEDGTLDAVVSDHHPWDEESKKLEFDQAEFGASTLETVFPALLAHSGFGLAALVDLLALRSRRHFGLAIPKLEKQQMANLTLFDPKHQWRYDASTRKSLSPYSPFHDSTLTGKVLATFHGAHYSIDPCLQKKN